MLCIGVIGAGFCDAETSVLAEEVWLLLAQAGATLVCGGLGGVMEAACKGADAEGGTTIGILPGEIRQSANQYVQIPIATGLGHARNIAVVKSAQAVIASSSPRPPFCSLWPQRSRNSLPIADGLRYCSRSPFNASSRSTDPPAISL